MSCNISNLYLDLLDTESTSQRSKISMDLVREYKSYAKSEVFFQVIIFRSSLNVRDTETGSVVESARLLCEKEIFLY